MQVALAFLGSVLGLMAVAALNYAVVGNVNVPLLLGCFGASCTLLFGAAFYHGPCCQHVKSHTDSYLKRQ